MSNEFFWYENLDQDNDFWTESAKIDFAVAMEQIMSKSKLSKSDLARRIGSSPAYITKVLRGDSNLTINTMVKLARAADGSLHLHISPQNHAVRWFEKIEGAKNTNRQPIVLEGTAWQQFAKNPSHGKISIAA